MPHFHESAVPTLNRWMISVGSAFGYQSEEYQQFIDAFFQMDEDIMKRLVNQAYAHQRQESYEE